MANVTRWSVVLSLLLVGAAELRAQPQDRPEPLTPLEKPTQAEQDRREALRLFAQGMLCQREDRLVEALKHFEQARQLDGKSADTHRALAPVYLAMGRLNDALDSCRKVLDLDPQDHATWYLYSRQLKEQGKTDEALKALTTAVACPSAKDQLDLLLQMNYELGVQHNERRDFAKAEAAFRAVISIAVDHREALLESAPYEPEQLDQETAKTFERIGQACMSAGAYDRAVAAYREAQKRAPDRAGRLSYHLAEVLQAQNKPAEALRQLDLHLKTQPPGAEAYELKITLLKKLKREADILPALEQAAGRDEHNVLLHLLLAKQYAQGKRWAEAERLYARMAETTPTADVYRGLFGIYKDQGAANKVLDLLDQTLRASASKDDGEEDDEAPVVSSKAAAAAMRGRAMLPVLRDDPEMVKAVLGVAKADLLAQRPRYRNTLRLLAVLAARTRQLPVAEQLYRACLPNLTAQTESEVYGGLLEVLMAQRKYQEVVDVCKQGREKAQATNLLLFQVKLAPALARLGKNDDAVAAMDEAVKLADDASRLGIHRLRIEILRQNGEYERAIKDGEALLQDYVRAGQQRDIRHVLSNVYSTAHQYAKSEEQLRLILESDPNDATACNDLGYIMADQNKNLEEAEKLIRKAIELDLAERKRGKQVGPEGEEANAAFIDSLGWVLFRLGKLDDARAELEKAARLMGGDDDPVVWDHLGDVYSKLNDGAKATAAWQKALSLYEQEKRRKMDDRYTDIKHKLETIGKQDKR